ncbi:MAG: septum site-determining protein MinC [Sulfurospirillaceae bacterium]|nr:septum site-determining protein MinC [Sulfurospirillaceae bacterium]MDD3463717.1 septum site-determining protein MinC [Sulfurospirillaceae bacterium]
MKVTQKNLRVFHILVNEETAFLDYFNKNSVLLKEFFLLLEGRVTPKICSILDKAQVCYKDISSCSLRLSGVKKDELPAQEQKGIEQKEPIATSKEGLKLKVYDRPIRSGEEISQDVPVVIFGRINSGSKLFCQDSVSVYGVIDGLVQCDGEYMVLNGIGERGNVIFNGEIIEKESVKHNVLQKITIRNHRVEIKEVV